MYKVFLWYSQSLEKNPAENSKVAIFTITKVHNCENEIKRHVLMYGNLEKLLSVTC